MVLFILDMRTEGGTLDGRSGNDVASWDLVAVSWTLSEYCFFYLWVNVFLRMNTFSLTSECFCGCDWIFFYKWISFKEWMLFFASEYNLFFASEYCFFASEYCFFLRVNIFASKWSIGTVSQSPGPWVNIFFGGSMLLLYCDSILLLFYESILLLFCESIFIVLWVNIVMSKLSFKHSRLSLVGHFQDQNY